MAEQPQIVAEDVVVRMDYTLTVDGEVVDSSDETGPIEFIQGSGNIIPGLERQIDGMGVDETREVDITPEEGYGEVNPDARVEVPRSEFPAEIPTEQGTLLQVRDGEGNILDARVESANDDRVLLDFNHPLAGKDLHFSVRIVGLRAPTDEELSHGHVHGSDGH